MFSTSTLIFKKENYFIKEIHQFSMKRFPSLHFIKIHFDELYFNLSLFDYYSIKLPSNMEESAKKRQAEYLASRYATSIALKNFGFENFHLKNTLERAPIWPVSIVGSLSHTSQQTIVVCTKDCLTSLIIGIDIERIINEDDCIKFSNYIINESELKNMSSIKLPFNIKLTLAFSLKESLFKAIYPKFKLFMDFNLFEILELNLESSSAYLCLMADFPPYFNKGYIFQGCFEIRKKEVITLVVDDTIAINSEIIN